MTESAPDPIASLLAAARRARQSGDHAGARALLHAITTRHPGDVRGWLLLATVAADRTEQRQALERALAINPGNQAARRALDTIIARDATESAPAITPPVELNAPAATVESPGASDEAEHTSTVRWPLYVLLGIAAIAILVAALLIWRPQDQQAQTPTSPPATAGASVATLEATSTAPTTAPIVGATELPTVEPIITTPPEPVPSTAAPVVEPTAEPLPGPSVTPALGFAQFQQQGTWVVSLLKPADAVILSGSIGQLQPQGRFVLTLVAIGNQSNSERKLPADLLTLVDAQGNRYNPQPAASTAYLQAYGEGQAGVVSMESNIAAGGALVSVPVIFDIPENAGGLQLTVDGAREGWRVGG